MSMYRESHLARPPIELEQGVACDVFVKLGGSILDQPAVTTVLVPHLSELAGGRRVLILTGGGQTVKRIKANQRSVGTHFYSCWRAGVLCLEVNAHLLASYSRRFTVVSSLADMTACFAAGNVAVFAPLAAMVHSLHLVPDWEETTDSIGLHFANVLGARRYVIVSDVDGIYRKRPGEAGGGDLIPCLTADELESLSSSKLDSAFPRYLRSHWLPTVIVNGRYPDRVSRAIRGETTICTRLDQDPGERIA
jgi:5-(aminomethyl)-3-furanmethanol phosphate kinase